MGGTSRFPETVGLAAARIGLAYGFDVQTVTSTIPPVVRKGTSGNAPAAKVTLYAQPIPASDIEESNRVAHVERQGCCKVAQLVRPHTSGEHLPQNLSIHAAYSAKGCSCQPKAGCPLGRCSFLNPT
jgi:hypothetical protein